MGDRSNPPPGTVSEDGDLLGPKEAALLDLAKLQTSSGDQLQQGDLEGLAAPFPRAIEQHVGLRCVSPQRLPGNDVSSGSIPTPLERQSPGAPTSIFGSVAALEGFEPERAV